jgi:protein SCO1/2
MRSIWLAVCILLSVEAPACREQQAPGEVWLAVRPAPAFDAYAVRRGGTMSSSEERGRPFMLAFGYTSCADVCPATLSSMHEIYRHLGNDASAVDAFYVSIDPERDRPERFRAFLEHFDARIEGLRLEPPALTEMLSAYGITAVKRPPTLQHYVGHDIDPNTDYSFDHSAGILVVDALGRLRIHYGFAAEPKVVAHGLQRLLEERGPRLRVSNARLLGYRPEVAAGYLELHNTGNADERLLGATSPLARAVELHELVHEGDLARMRPAPGGFGIAPSETLALTPGGKHLMFQGLAAAPERRTVPVVLTFEHEAPLRVELQVVLPSAPTATSVARGAQGTP